MSTASHVPWEERHPRRALAADGVGLLLVLLLLLDCLRPALLWLPTIAAGGDTPCHYPTAVWFRDHLLPRWRLHGWYPGAYLGQPLLLYYFPLPFLVMSALAPAVGMPVAFKLGIALPVLALPLLAYAAFRLLGFRFPAPLLAAGAATMFLFVEDNPIWGGTLASTLTGEFAYTYGTGLALLFLGLAYRSYARGRAPWLPAGLLALTALAHGYAVLWAGLSVSYFLWSARRPLRTLLWLLALAALAFAFAAFWLLPLLADWGWTTPYDDAWITISARNLFPPLLWPLFLAAVLGLGGTFALARRTGGPDQRLLFLLHAGAMAAALVASGPALGIIDVRFAPFGQLALALLGAAAVGLVLARTVLVDVAALGVLLVGLLFAEQSSRLVRPWVDYDFTGLEARDGWPAFRELTRRLGGGVSDPRVAVEYSERHESAGSIRMYETLPLFSGRSTLEGVYNQASVMTHPVYYLASELGARSPNPFKKREYAQFDPPSALRHLRLLNAAEVVALSPELTSALDARGDVALEARVAPYSVYRLLDPGPGYVEPLTYAPVRSSPKGWRDKAYRWFARQPPSRAFLVFTDDPRFRVRERDEWLAPPEIPLPGTARVHATLAAESIDIDTDRPGHPLLVKVSFHPRWRARGADGPYLVAPGLMLIVPRQAHVRLEYAARNWADRVGLSLTFAALLGALALAWRSRRRVEPVAPEAPLPLDACALPAPPTRWGGAVPAAVWLLLLAGRVAGDWSGPPVPVDALYEKASRAYADERYADAAEYALHALPAVRGTPLWAELACLRGESLLRAERPSAAARAFETIVGLAHDSPYVAQALFGLAQARRDLGDAAGAEEARQRLVRDYAETPWAQRARALQGDRRDPPGAAPPR